MQAASAFRSGGMYPARRGAKPRKRVHANARREWISSAAVLCGARFTRMPTVPRSPQPASVLIAAKAFKIAAVSGVTTTKTMSAARQRCSATQPPPSPTSMTARSAVDPSDCSWVMSRSRDAQDASPRPAPERRGALARRPARFGAPRRQSDAKRARRRVWHSLRCRTTLRQQDPRYRHRRASFGSPALRKPPQYRAPRSSCPPRLCRRRKLPAGGARPAARQPASGAPFVEGRLPGRSCSYAVTVHKPADTLSRSKLSRSERRLCRVTVHRPADTLSIPSTSRATRPGSATSISSGTFWPLVR